MAPAEFTYAAPWWPLFESPEEWELDLNTFLNRYRSCLQLFLKALRNCEDRELRRGSLTESQRLSDRMARSINDGLFWFCLAARKSFMFDEIYWSFLGPLGSLDDRLSLLSQQEQDDLDGLVQKKLRQAEEKRLDENSTLDDIVDL